MADETADTEASEMSEVQDTEILGEQTREVDESDALFKEEESELGTDFEIDDDVPQPWETYAVESISLEDEMSDVILPEERLEHIGLEEEEVIAEKIEPEESIQESKLQDSSTEIYDHEEFTHGCKSMSHIDLKVETGEIKLVTPKPKGRYFRKFSENLDDSDVESVSVESIVLPRLIKEPLLLRQIYPEMKSVKFDEHTDRLDPGDIFEVESVYDEKRFFEQEDKIEEVEKKENAILRISFIKKIMVAWIPRRDTMEVFERFFDFESESATSEGQVKRIGSPKLFSESSISSSEHFDKLSQYFLISMCRKYKDRYWDLVLHGKEVEKQIGRRIVDDDVLFIFEFCSYNDAIRYVDLCYNHITSVGLAIIAEYLTLNHNIIGLNVMGNEIQWISKLTRKYLGSLSNLRQLRLNGNPLNKSGRINAACLLRYNQLELLDLAETSQTLRSVAWIAEFAQNCKSIKVLDVSRILGQRGYNLRTYQVALFFSDILKHNKSLAELHLEKNRLNDNDIEQLMVGLVEHQRLKAINLTCNDICDFGAEIIAKNLDKIKSLISLSLACNKIRNAGTRALSLRLPYSKITILNLARNEIGDEGMIDLMYSIRKPYPLQALFIFGNPFGETTLETLSDCLKTCTLSPNTVDTHVTIVDGAFSVVHYPLGDRYKPRYYRQYESWRPGVWRWNGAPPMYYGIKQFRPSNRFKDRNKFPNPTWESDINACGI